MAISKVRVKINGVWTNLTLSNGKWTGSITAPSTTSYTQPDKYYPVTVEVTNDAGTVVTKDATDATLGAALRLAVKETMKPVIALVSPSNGAYVTNNKQAIVFKVTDEAAELICQRSNLNWIIRHTLLQVRGWLIPALPMGTNLHLRRRQPLPTENTILPSTHQIMMAMQLQQ